MEEQLHWLEDNDYIVERSRVIHLWYLGEFVTEQADAVWKETTYKATETRCIFELAKKKKAYKEDT